MHVRCRPGATRRRSVGSNPARRRSAAAASTTFGNISSTLREVAAVGLPLTLVLDHGDPTNNRRENLRLVCPDCDSQLPTYKSRNRGKGRHFRRQRYANGQSY
ncbi:hypothetical protein MPUL_29600 [Mycolicibacterium pulveris]|uniref:HNH endonuclease n=1 Tax=Mycolicibacterium pulveris TaxID=36813 RepID=A0A7I7UK48_MYCPV|nr:hypothetical protein MPUL_29600 [Mycolicibacterium pulveris]